jgi:hypothetical protein
VLESRPLPGSPQLEDPSSNAGLRFGTLSHYQLAVRQEVVDVTLDFFMRHKDG